MLFQKQRIRYPVTETSTRNSQGPSSSKAKEGEGTKFKPQGISHTHHIPILPVISTIASSTSQILNQISRLRTETQRETHFLFLEVPISAAMPPRGGPKAVSSTASPESSKRKLDEGGEVDSPRRRSKRVKSVENIKAQSSSDGSRGAAKGISRAAVKEEIEEEKEETEVSIKGHDEVEEKVAKTKTPAKKRKSKEDQEAQAMPLRPRTPGLRMCVGAHVSAAKGVFNAINNSVHIGGNAIALFLKSQRKWDNPPLQDDVRDQFRRLCAEQKYDAAKHILPHGSYLVNLAQEEKAKAKQAYDSFLDDLRRCEALGIELYNFHPGSANQTSLPSALSRLAKALTNALSETTTVIPVLETMCGHGSTIGGSLTEFRDLLALIPQKYHSRIGICIDTCHSFAAGYDLATPTGFQAFMQEFEDVIGIQHLRALHLNDSKAPRGSKRDLHANIGTGFLGLRAFHSVMNEPRFEDLPMVLETPIDRPVSESKGGKPKPAGAKTKMEPDTGVWAREIELLESLIGMDPEGDEFKQLEARLAEEGREVREKHQEQYKRKLEAEDKKKNKSPAKKGQKTLMEMMNGSKKRGKAEPKIDIDSEDEGCQSC